MFYQGVVKNWKKYTNPKTCWKLYFIKKIVEDLKFFNKKMRFTEILFLDFYVRIPPVEKFYLKFYFKKPDIFYTFWKPLISCFQINYGWFWLIRYSWLKLKKKVKIFCFFRKFGKKNVDFFFGVLIDPLPPGGVSV